MKENDILKCLHIIYKIQVLANTFDWLVNFDKNSQKENVWKLATFCLVRRLPVTMLIGQTVLLLQ